MYTCVQRPQEGITCPAPSLAFLPRDRVSHWTGARLSASKSQQSSCLCSTGAEIAEGECSSTDFHCGCWDLNPISFYFIVFLLLLFTIILCWINPCPISSCFLVFFWDVVSVCSAFSGLGTSLFLFHEVHLNEEGSSHASQSDHKLRSAPARLRYSMVSVSPCCSMVRESPSNPCSASLCIFRL